MQKRQLLVLLITWKQRTRYLLIFEILAKGNFQKQLTGFQVCASTPSSIAQSWWHFLILYICQLQMPIYAWNMKKFCPIKMQKREHLFFSLTLVEHAKETGKTEFWLYWGPWKCSPVSGFCPTGIQMPSDAGPAHFIHEWDSQVNSGPSSLVWTSAGSFFLFFTLLQELGWFVINCMN